MPVMTDEQEREFDELVAHAAERVNEVVEDALLRRSRYDERRLAREAVRHLGLPKELLR